MKSSPLRSSAGYSRQKPCVPRKSGSPESTPMPAPVTSNNISAVCTSLAAFFSSKSSAFFPIISVIHDPNPLQPHFSQQDLARQQDLGQASSHRSGINPWFRQKDQAEARPSPMVIDTDNISDPIRAFIRTRKPDAHHIQAH